MIRASTSRDNSLLRLARAVRDDVRLDAEEARHREHERDDAERRTAEAYWRSRIEELPGRPELPLAIAPEQLGRPRFVAHRAELPAAGWRRLSAGDLARMRF